MILESISAKNDLGVLISVVIDILPYRHLVGLSWQWIFHDSYFFLSQLLSMEYHTMFDNAGFHFDLVTQKVLVIESTDGFNLVFMGLKQVHFQKSMYFATKKFLLTR